VSTEPTTADQYEELLICAQRNWRKSMDGDITPDERGHAMAHACSFFSTAWLLHKFVKADENAAAAAALELHEILSDAGAAGEYIWQMLASIGIDPDAVAPIQSVPAGEETPA
jgi:hypothetical protein